MSMTRAEFETLDADDKLAFTRARFRIPDDLIYLDGNSLGVLPEATPARMAEMVEREWGRDLIASWNKHGWMDMPLKLGAKTAPLIGADADEVLVADTVSVNIFKLAAAALKMRPGRQVIVTETGNFPTDLYILQGLAEFYGGDCEVRAVPRDKVRDALDDDVALLLLTHTHYKTGALFDMKAMTQAAHDAGALTLWDLSHSAGAVELDLHGANCDFAVGCGYKYLNGGPGAPGFLFIALRHQDDFQTPLSGWLGHDRPFDFIDEYRPASGVRRAMCSSPSILALTALEEGLKTFDGVEMSAVRAKSRELGELFIQQVEARCGDMFTLGCSRDSSMRGSQVSLRHADGYPIMQAIIERGVIGDFRDPDILRFGFTPLYTRYVDIFDAVEHLADVMKSGEWKEPRFAERSAVT